LRAATAFVSRRPNTACSRMRPRPIDAGGRAYLGAASRGVYRRFSPSSHARALHDRRVGVSIDMGARLQSTSSSDTPATNDSIATTELLYAELKSIASQLRHYDDLYYNSGQPTVTDDEYDALARKEAEICAANPDLVQRLGEESGLGKKATRWGGRVGYVIQQSGDGYSDNNSNVDVSGRKTKVLPAGRTRGKLTHLPSAPMMSLDNAMSNSDVVRWVNRVRKLMFSKQSAKVEQDGESHDEDEKNEAEARTISLNILAEPKMDGLSLSLRYEHFNIIPGGNTAADKCLYRFKWGATRGDGTRGEDVTDGVVPLLSSNESGSAQGGTIPSDFSVALPEGMESPPPIIEIRGEVVLPRARFRMLQNAYDEAVAQASDAASGDEEAVDDETTIKANGDSTPILPVRFANARNAASGILLRSKGVVDEDEATNTRMLRSQLRFYAYDVTEVKLFGEDGETLMRTLQECGFNVPEPTLHETIDLSDKEDAEEGELTSLFEYHQRLMDLRDTVCDDGSLAGHLNHDIDGAVYKISALAARESLGSSSRAPRWAIAHKFPIQAAVTTIQGVEVQVGRTGALTPVAVLEPVDIGGVSVSRASLHNFVYAAQLLCPDIDGQGTAHVRRGTRVVVGRAGDVIPQVLRLVQTDANSAGIAEGNDDNEFISLLPPPTCPACGSRTIFDPSDRAAVKKTADADKVESANENASSLSIVAEQRAGQVLRCSAPHLLCPPRAVGALNHAFSRPGLDVPGLSEARLQQLVDEGLIHVPADLFRVVAGDLEPIASLPGWGVKSSEKLASAAQEVASNGISLSRFIYSLGIRHIGVHTSKLIATAYGTASAFLADVEAAPKACVTNVTTDDATIPFQVLNGDDGVKGIGPIMIESLVSFSDNEALVQAAKDLSGVITVLDEPTAERSVPSTSGRSDSGQFDGLTIVFTGAIPGMSRADAQQAAITLGAKNTPGSISRSTDLVVEGAKGGKKALKAKEMGIRVIKADEFLQIVNGHSA